MDIFDIVTVQRIVAIAEAANKVGTLGRCSVVVTGEYRIAIVFDLESCFQSVLTSSNDEYYESSCKNGGLGKPPYTSL